MHNKPFRLLTSLCFFCLATITALAQNNTKSPYSRFGIGDLAFQGFSIQNGMSQSGSALRRGGYINPLNPASYNSLVRTVYETGALLENGTISSGGQSQYFRNASFGYLALGMPVMKKIGWGASFGMQPVSHVGYNISNYLFTGSNNILTQTSYTGRGGLSKFYMGHSFKLWSCNCFDTLEKPFQKHELNGGFNVNYVYGQMKIGKAAYFGDTSFTTNNYKEDRTRYIGDVTFDLGLQYVYRPNDTRSLTIGATYAPARTLAGHQVVFARTVYPGYYDRDRDTLLYTETANQPALKLPAAWGLGMVYQIQGLGKDLNDKKKQNELILTLDIKGQDWRKYSIFGQQDSLQNSFSFAAGAAFTPLTDLNVRKKRLAKVEYRTGFRFAQTNLQLNGEPIAEYGMSVGAGVPLKIRKTRDNSAFILSKINLSVEYFKRGTLNGSLLQENHLRFTLGITFEDEWFQKWKFD